MKRIKVILFVFSLLMVMPNTIYAICDYNEKSELQSLAGNLNFTYNYIESGEGINSNVKFSITIANMNQKLYVVDQTNVRVYNYNGSELVIDNYNPGSTIQFIVYGNTENCMGVELMNNYITLPSYNRFYKDSVCKGVSNYKLCNRWTRVDFTYDEFKRKVQQYKAQLNVKEEPVISEEVGLVEKIMIFLSKYSLYIFGMIIVICGGLIIYLKRKDDFDLN